MNIIEKLASEFKIKTSQVENTVEPVSYTHLDVYKRQTSD